MRPSRIITALSIVLASVGADAQQDATDATEFPGAAMRFLGDEMPQMENAIAERNRDYFEEAMTRVIQFSDQWGYKTRDNPALARYPMCTDAVSEFLAVGMCRIMTTNPDCDPALAQNFDVNLRKCREMAAGR